MKYEMLTFFKKVKRKALKNHWNLIRNLLMATVLSGMLAFFGWQSSASAHAAHALTQCPVNRAVAETFVGTPFFDGDFVFPLSTYPDRALYDFAQVYYSLDAPDSPRISVESVGSGAAGCGPFIDVDLYPRPLADGEPINEYRITRNNLSTGTHQNLTLSGSSRTLHITTGLIPSTVETFEVNACSATNYCAVSTPVMEVITLP